MDDNENLRELNDELKDEFNDFDTMLTIHYLADEFHTTRSIKAACDLADAVYEYFNS